jgi:putative addiction module component (TIGR02574 family)
VDLTTLMREVDGWPVDERIHLVQAIWDRIVESGEVVDLTDAQKADLERRLAELDAAPNDVLKWDEITAHLRRPR